MARRPHTESDRQRSRTKITGPDDFASVFQVSRETTDRLVIFAELLARWQKTINLVAPSTLNDVWHRHFADSAQLLVHMPPNARLWVDVGSGGGFPGLVIAIALSEKTASAVAPTARKVVLFESDTRKCAFMAEVVRKTELKNAITVEIRNQRIEIPETRVNLGSVDVVSARALAPLSQLLAWLSSIMPPAAIALLLKGREADKEIAHARETWQFECDQFSSVTDASGKILKIQNVELQSRG